ncbi:glycosyltransferase family 39 protein [Haladaptatus sp. R4]|uniref:ArnT family glycosyltransferase n=1 Tax=Haladaptatus sp. R4 TaxID=1679489 RepID=UPI001CBE3393|nr:glycosyltransferase family 39 protein [Haladaptatus sp. R4]
MLYFYIGTHPYGSFGAGLYFHIAEQIQTNGYVLPKTIPNYTPAGVPFAYPPLMFYVVALLQNVTHLDAFTIARFLPGLVSVAYLVPLYFLARDLFGSRPQAALATLIVAVSPPVLQWHISSGGIVRAPAMLFSLVGIYAGLHLFRDGDERWLAPALIAFTLTVLTHPMYTIFFVISFLLLYARFDRSLRGMGYGLIVGLGGLVLTAPWWLSVIAMHGSSVFSGAAGTHGGLGGAVPALYALLRQQIHEPPFLSAWHLLPVVGCLWLVWRKEYFLPAWLVVIMATMDEARFVFLIGALISARFIFEGILRWIRKSASVGRNEIVTFSVVLLATIGLSGGMLYATGGLNAHAGSPSLPGFVDNNDVEAMSWASTNTDPSAQFVVLGDAAEWFPQQTHRTIAVGPWGVEWKGHQQYRYQLHHFRTLSRSHTAAALTSKLMRMDVHPQYVYVPKGAYTIRGMRHTQPSMMLSTMQSSPQYHLVFENDGVAVFEMADGWYPSGPGPSGPMPV